MNLDNKVVLITGSTRGIGNSIARLFLENKAKVVICGSNIDNAKKAVESIKSDLNINDDNIMPVGLNMKNKESIKDKWRSYLRRFKFKKSKS